MTRRRPAVGRKRYGRSRARHAGLPPGMRLSAVRVTVVMAVLAALVAGCSGSTRSPVTAGPSGGGHSGNGHSGNGHSGGTAATSSTAANLHPCPAPGRTASTSRGLPDLTLPCLGGGADVHLRQLTGTPTVLNLWASWCPPCREETPALARFAGAAAGQVRVLGVASGDSSKRTSLSFDASAGVRYPSLWDPQLTLREHLGVPGMPVTLLVTAAGRVVWTHAGAVTAQSLAQAVAAHLGVTVHV